MLVRRLPPDCRIHLLCFIPGYNVRSTNLPHACEKGEGCEDQRSYDPFPFIEESNNPLGGLSNKREQAAQQKS